MQFGNRVGIKHQKLLNTKKCWKKNDDWETLIKFF